MPRRNHGQGRQDGGQARGIREQAQDVGRRMQEGAGEMGHRIQEGYESAREEAARRYRDVEGALSRNPAKSVMIGFGVGFGLGLVLTTLLARPRGMWAERYLPDSWRRAPESLHHLASTVRDIPETLAHRMKHTMGSR